VSWSVTLRVVRLAWERYDIHMATPYAPNAPTADIRPETRFTHTYVTGGGGVRLHVVDTGNPTGRPIVLIHGFSQSWLSWRRQVCSDLADDYRLVALDLRGHGGSDKPRDAYSDHRPWAEDVNAVLSELQLDRPVLCGWSYGSLVILDYIRKYGEDAISGICLVDAITRLGSEAALSVLTPELLNLVPGFFSTDVADSVPSLESLLRLCFVQEPSAEDLYLMLGYNLQVPPHVRQALFTRTFDNDAIMARIRTPVLVVHGAEDAIVKPSIVDQHTACMPHAQVCLMPNAGHAPFWDDAATFNRLLRAFCQDL
jgi:pimeloyl-ACP methyl ester carboxylesterase